MAKGNKNAQNKSDIKLVKTSKKKAVDETTKQLRKLYNQLLLKDKKDKSPIVQKVMKLIDAKYNEYCYKADGCRLLQGCIKHGSKAQKQKIIDALLPYLLNIINGKYSIYLSAKMFKYSDSKQKNYILNDVIKPNFTQILQHSNGISFTKIVFTYSNSAYQTELIDYYIKNYFKISFDKLESLKKNSVQNKMEEEMSKNIIVENDLAKDENALLLESVKKHLEKQLEIGVNKNFIFHGFLNKLYAHLDAHTQIYVSELLDDDLLPLLDSKDGFEAACKIYTVSSAKTKKKFIKNIKEKLDDFISDENGLIFVIKVVLFTDDTVAVNKSFLQSLLQKISDSYTEHKKLLTVFWNVFYPFTKKGNKKMYQDLLEYDVNSSTKKPLAKRQEELVGYVFDKFIKVILFEIRDLMADMSYNNLLSDLLLYLENNSKFTELEQTLNAVLNVLESDIKMYKDSLENTMLNNKICQMTVKRIMKDLTDTAKANKNIKKFSQNFHEKIVQFLKTDLGSFLKTKAIFIIVQILENSATKNLLINDLNKYKKDILENKDNPKLSGMVLLAKLL